MNSGNILVLTDFIYGFCLGGALLAWLLVLRKIYELSRFRRQIVKLSTHSLPDENPFAGRSLLAQAANSYVGAFRRAAERNSLKAFMVDQRLIAVRSYLQAGTSWPRAAVGLLILGSLLVTLINLQNSVAQLGNAFRSISQGHSSAASKEVKGDAAQPAGVDVAAVDADAQAARIENVREGMATVADSARSAFTRSGWILLSCVVILFCNMFTISASGRAALYFAKWSHESYDEALATTTANDPASRTADLVTAVNKMHEIVTGFQATADSFAGLGQFGDKLEASTAAISDAMSRLPASVSTAVTSIGGEVARYLGEDIKHQLTYLMKISTIYADQELRIQEIQKFLAESVRIATVVENVPARLGELATSIRGHSTATERLMVRLNELDAKIDAFPVVDLKRSSSEMHDVVQGLAESGRIISDSATGLMDFLGGWRSVIRVELERVSATVAEGLLTSSTALTKSLSGSKEDIESALGLFRSENARALALLDGIQTRLQTSSGRTDTGLAEVKRELDLLAEEIRTLDNAGAHSVWHRWLGRQPDSRHRGKAAGS